MKKTMQRASLLFAFGAGLAVGPLRQDPKPVPVPVPATAPAPAATPANPDAAPAAKPAATPAAKSNDALPGAPKPSPFQGVYRLTTRWVDGNRRIDPGSGYLAITARHLFLCVGAAGASADTVQLRSSVRTWRVRDNQLHSTVLRGWLTDERGTIVFEPEGTEEMRRIELVRGGLRIVQDPRNWLEFERVE
jgi:hypothetical protein